MLGLFGHYENGTSEMYDQFVKNIILNGLHENVVPIPATTKTGFDLLKFYNIKPDMIYIDASHAEEDVYLDVKNYTSLGNENTLVFGDDAPWESVTNGLNRACSELNRKVEIVDTFFWKIV